MKVKWLAAFFIVIFSAVFVFSALAGHASRSRSTGSVITTGNSRIILFNNRNDGDDDDDHHKLISQVDMLTGGGNSNGRRYEIRVSEQIRPVSGQSTIRGIAFCAPPGSRFSTELPLTGGGSGTPKPKPANAPSFSSSSTVSSGQIDSQGRFNFAVTSSANLAALNPATICGNPSWRIVDWVPVEFESVVTETVIRVKNNGKHKWGYTQSYSVDRCVLPNPNTLQYRERRAYQCTVVREIEVGGRHRH
jgi:hypothetical protein